MSFVKKNLLKFNSGYPEKSIIHILVFFMIFTSVLGLIYHLGKISLLGNFITEIYAVLFLISPVLYLKYYKGTEKTDDSSIYLHILTGFAVSITVLSVYLGIYYFFFSLKCTDNQPVILGRNCRLFNDFVWPESLKYNLNVLAFHLIAVAWPEEYFYRGFILPMILKSKSWKNSGFSPLVFTVVIQAVLFAAGHFLLDFNPIRLAVFFPALLLGYLVIRTGSIIPGIIFHGLANYFSWVIEKGFFHS
ncbi:MAG: CPBP family intramembrane metalloprotease [Deltaproteobacteria bacterium]|nr:CPBP family intramembrane metalloprotease [Deltaproteobacteria bacterium]